MTAPVSNSVPEWRLVPVEPDNAMLVAMRESGAEGSKDELARDYKAALAAAPAAPAAPPAVPDSLAIIKAVQSYLVDVVRAFGDVSCAAYISTWHKSEEIAKNLNLAAPVAQAVPVESIGKFSLPPMPDVEDLCNSWGYNESHLRDYAFDAIEAYKASVAAPVAQAVPDIGNDERFQELLANYADAYAAADGLHAMAGARYRLQAYLNSRLVAPALQAVPEGFVPMPAEPSEAILQLDGWPRLEYERYKDMLVAAQKYHPAPVAQAVPVASEEDLRKALRKAFNFGQTYWQQADSDSFRQQDKSSETVDKYTAFVNETCAAFAAQVTPP